MDIFGPTIETLRAHEQWNENDLICLLKLMVLGKTVFPLRDTKRNLEFTRWQNEQSDTPLVLVKTNI